jgi:O-antigen biosynthesis protein WbqV
MASSFLKTARFKKAAIVVHDLLATALAIVLTFAIRFDEPLLSERLRQVPAFLPPFLAYAALVYWWFALYQSRWRFASLPDLANIFKAAGVLALSLLVVDYLLVSPRIYGGYVFGKIAIGLYWLLQMALLGGPRLAYRYLQSTRSRRSVEREGTAPTLLLGRGSDVEIVLRAIEAGTVRRLRPVGILSHRDADQGQTIRGVPVLGAFADLEQAIGDFAERGVPVRRLLATPSALQPEAEPDALIARARRLGLPLVRLSSLGEGLHDAEIAPLEIEDLLLRPTVETDRARLHNFVRGKRVMVTGGGGSIGSEICARAVAFGASDLLVLEHSEPALHEALESPSLLSGDARVEGVIADVRDRDRVRAVATGFRPDVIFHAAALKHVPYLEKDWAEGVRTNVLGSVNVADAGIAAGARAVVLISTDKAIEPVSVLGATKRFAEMYAQALDAERAGDPDATRLIAVRFGNVLGSAGSVVPKFKAQIARGGPVTVTHPDMVRYFMTVREAADLVLTAASHADGEGRGPGQGRGPGEVRHPQEARRNTDERAAVYVLAMGQPVRIRDLAERMIRLAGFEPGEDIAVAITGPRPGERLHEILFAREEGMAETGIAGVMAAKPAGADRARIERWLERLGAALAADDRAGAERVFAEAIPDFRKRAARTPEPGPPTRPASPPRAAASRAR